MYQYEFVKIELKKSWFKMVPKEDYREIVYFYSQDGWRLVQIFDPSTTGYGTSSYFELIFEKEI